MTFSKHSKFFSLVASRFAVACAAALVVCAVLVTDATRASAQMITPLGVRFDEGPGIKLGESFILHPGLTAEMRFDSNPLAVQTQATAAPYMRIIPHIALSTRSGRRMTDSRGRIVLPKLQFRVQGAAGYRHYFHDNNAVSDQRAVEVRAGLDLKVNPNRHFNFAITDSYSRTVTSTNGIQLAVGDTTEGFTISRNLNRAYLGALIAPGGGRLNFTVSYTNTLDFIEQINNMNRMRHEIGLLTKYLVLPKTAVMLEFVQGIAHFLSDQTGLDVPNRNSLPLRVGVGVVGLLTPTLQFLAKVGYTNGLYSDGDSFSTAYATAMVGWDLAPTAKLRIGFDRTAKDSLLGNFIIDNRPYAVVDWTIWRFLVGANAGYVYREFGGLDAINGRTTEELTMHLFTAGANVDFAITEWFFVGVGYNLQVQSLGANTLTANDFIGVRDYSRHQAFGRVAISY